MVALKEKKNRVTAVLSDMCLFLPSVSVHYTVPLRGMTNLSCVRDVSLRVEIVRRAHNRQQSNLTIHRVDKNLLMRNIITDCQSETPILNTCDFYPTLAARAWKPTFDKSNAYFVNLWTFVNNIDNTGGKRRKRRVASSHLSARAMVLIGHTFG